MKKLKIISTVFALLLLELSVPAIMFGQAFPLKLSSNKRYFVDQDNRPFLINGDTPWLMIQKMTLEEIKLYLDDRKNKKINTIQIMLNDYHTPINDLNREGNRPFRDPDNFSTINESYFLFVDKVINEARSRGIGVIIAPLWRDCCSEGWRTAMNANGVIKCRQFGEYLGTRYSRSNHPNMIAWMMGGDHEVDDTYDEYKAVAEGIKQKDSGTFLTYHLNPGGKSTDKISDSWLNLNATYTYGDVYKVSYDAYKLTPVMPFYLAESLYEGLLQNNSQDNARPSRIRKQAYWSILSGSAGHIYGTDAWDVPSNWKDFLNLPGANDLTHLANLFSDIEWYKLAPDFAHQLVTNGYGTYGKSNYVTAALSTDKRLGVAYLPSTGTEVRTITVDMSKLNAKPTCKWFNPTTGEYIIVGKYASQGSKNFTTPGSNGANANDWVLILDARNRTAASSPGGKQ